MSVLHWSAVCFVVAIASAQQQVAAANLDARTKQTVVGALDEMLKSFDRNGDNRLDQTERETLEKAIVERHGARWLEPVQVVLTEADANGDGVLAESEWTGYTGRTTTARPKQPGTRTEMVTMSDGIRLATDIHLPDGEGPWPVILMRTPYSRTQQGGRSDGVALVVQDTRGRFDSEGWNFPFVGCGWEGHQDGKDTVDWIRSQPWCDGRVFSLGGSALGITQNLMAVSQPEGLLSQYIVVATADLYRHAAYVGGAFRKSQVEGWTDGNDYDPKAVETLRSHYEYDELWARYDTMANSSKINVPAIHVGGWFDTFALGTIDSYRVRQHQGGEGAKGKQRLVMGAWTHGINRPLSVAGAQFPNQQMPRAYTTSAWIERCIHGRDDDAAQVPPVAYYVMGDTNDSDARGNEWRFADDWPIPHQPTAYYFHGDGSLSTERPGKDEDTCLEYTFDPAAPCPTRGGCNLCIEAGPKKQNDVEDRGDVLTFTTEPLTEPIEVTGHPQIRIFLSSSAVDTDLSVRLTDVYPDGSSFLMAEGMLRVRYRDSRTESNLLEPGKVYEIAFESWPTSIVVNRGHRIRVAVTSSNYPRFDLNPGTGQPWESIEESVKQVNRIFCSAQQASHMVLPVVSAAAE